MIKLYSTPTCGPCATIKRFLDINKIPYEVLGIDRMQADGIKRSPYLLYKDWEPITSFDIKKLNQIKEDYNGTV